MTLRNTLFLLLSYGAGRRQGHAGLFYCRFEIAFFFEATKDGWELGKGGITILCPWAEGLRCRQQTFPQR